MSDEEGAKNTIAGLNRLKKIGEDHGVTICIELLNSKVDHKDYMCDHTTWGVQVVQAVNSPRVKLLYDIYHMQIMEGDLVATIQKNIEWLGIFILAEFRIATSWMALRKCNGMGLCAASPAPATAATSPTNSCPRAIRSLRCVRPSNSATSN